MDPRKERHEFIKKRLIKVLQPMVTELYVDGLIMIRGTKDLDQVTKSLATKSLDYLIESYRV